MLRRPQPLSRNDALCFTVTVFATVAFGDMVPVPQTARCAWLPTSSWWG
ncbi:ion channel [Streptomyces sp. NPDC054887]